MLIFSSLTMALSVEASQKGKRGNRSCSSPSRFCAAGFMVIKSIEYSDKYFHHTIVAKDSKGKFFVYDGHQEKCDAKEVKLLGYAMPLC